MEDTIYMDYDSKGSNDKELKELEGGLKFMYNMMTVCTSFGWFVSTLMNLSEGDWATINHKWSVGDQLDLTHRLPHSYETLTNFTIESLMYCMHLLFQ